MLHWHNDLQFIEYFHTYCITNLNLLTKLWNFKLQAWCPWNITWTTLSSVTPRWASPTSSSPGSLSWSDHPPQKKLSFLSNLTAWCMCTPHLIPEDGARINSVLCPENWNRRNLGNVYWMHKSGLNSAFQNLICMPTTRILAKPKILIQ